MQVSVVMVMALSGLGCQNKGDDAFPAPLMYQARRALRRLERVPRLRRPVGLSGIFAGR